MVSPVNASYGIVGPVSWNGPGGNEATLVLRVSPPSVKFHPLPPVDRRFFREVYNQELILRRQAWVTARKAQDSYIWRDLADAGHIGRR